MFSMFDCSNNSILLLSIHNFSVLEWSVLCYEMDTFFFFFNVLMLILKFHMIVCTSCSFYLERIKECFEYIEKQVSPIKNSYILRRLCKHNFTLSKLEILPVAGKTCYYCKNTCFFILLFAKKLTFKKNDCYKENIFRMIWSK